VGKGGWAVPCFVRCASLEEALEAGHSFGARFVIKQPNRHSTKGIYPLEEIGDGQYLELLRLREMTPSDLRVDGTPPDYWLAEQIIPSFIPGKPLPFDYKVYCFEGRPTLIPIYQIDRNVWPPQVAAFDGAFFPLHRGRHYDTDRRRWEAGYPVLPRYAPQILAFAHALFSSRRNHASAPTYLRRTMGIGAAPSAGAGKGDLSARA